MTIKRLDHVSVVVDDLAAAIAFFTALGMTLEGEAEAEAGSRAVEIVDARRVRLQRVNGLSGQLSGWHASTSDRLESFRDNTGVTNRCTAPTSVEHG
jgi:catechol 2,3-dioxygenase-like lactoylglutathione lyase family enzyme